MNSTSFSNENTLVLDFNGRCLRRALDKKVGKLQSLLSADEDITIELDKLVGHLLKLALCTSNRLRGPPSLTWMQFKLFDLLTLTERAIEKRKMHFMDSNAMKAIELGAVECNLEDCTSKTRQLMKKEDSMTKKIMGDYGFFDQLAELCNSTKRLISVHKIIVPDIEKTRGETQERNVTELKMLCPKDMKSILSVPDGDHLNSKPKKKVCRRKTRKTRNVKILSRNLKKIKRKLDYATGKLSRGSKDPLKKAIISKKSSYKSFLSVKYQAKPKKKIRQNQNVRSTSKPISDSMTNLCPEEIFIQNHVDDLTDGSSKCYDTNNINQSNVCLAMSKQSIFIDIVTHDKQETIAFRRTTGTDTGVESIGDKDITKKPNLSTEHNYHNEQKIFENDEQTIFLFDINEPTTSKGIRHVITDAQCGPDTVYTSIKSKLSTPSLARMPKLISTAIKIGDTITDVKCSKNCSDFGTSTNVTHEDTQVVCSRFKSVGIRIKDSDTMISKPVVSPKISSEKVFESQKISQYFAPDNKCGIKIFDSTSDFCSADSFSKSPNMSRMLKSTAYLEEASPEMIFSSNSPPKLVCGGVHVHSYRDRVVTEDVVFQGNWQLQKPKSSLTNKKNYKVAAIKKANELGNLRRNLNSKEKFLKKKSEHKIQLKQPMSMKSNDPKKIEKCDTNWLKQNNKLPDSTKTTGTKRNNIFAKISNKAAVGSLNKNTKEIKNAEQKPVVKNEEEKEKKKYKIKNYVPLYLRKNVAKSGFGENLNKSIDSVKTGAEKKLNHYSAVMMRSKTEIIKKKLSKFYKEPVRNVNYLVFRNEIEFKRNSTENGPTISTPEVIKGPEKVKDQILHSLFQEDGSECSSSTNAKAITVDQKYSIQKGQTISKESCSKRQTELEHLNTAKNNKYSKNCSAEKIEINQNCRNKENSPDPTFFLKKSHKVTVKNAKRVLSGVNKNVFLVQVNSDNSKQPVQKTNKSNIRIPNVESIQEEKEVSKASASNPKSEEFGKPEIKCTEQHENDTEFNCDLALDSSQAQIVCNGTVDTATQQKVLDDINIINNANVTSLQDVAYDVRPLIENMLLCILSEHELHDTSQSHNTYNSEDPSPRSSSVSYKTVIYDEMINTNTLKSVLASNNDVMNNASDANTVNEKTIKCKETLSGDKLTNALINKTFESTQHRESAASLTDSITMTDLDLSYSSLTSASKVSEYYLADNELLSSQEKFGVAPVNESSVCGIFERKGQRKVQNVGGFRALQVFSGFSIDAEPTIGDRPDFVNLLDSETSSYAPQINRQTASEELYVTGRSTHSFNPCPVEEVAEVPSWLFNIISQQQQPPQEPEPHQVVYLPLPVEVPVPIDAMDINGNVSVDSDSNVIRATTGAGDGRGIHSDNSQDSSGLGTSVTSSEISSEQQSEEASSLNYSSFTGHYERIQESSGSGAGGGSFDLTRPISPDSSFLCRPQQPLLLENTSNENALLTSNIDQGRITSSNRLSETSDADADVSSTDTDIPYLSDV